MVSHKYCIICFWLILVASVFYIPSLGIADELDDALAMNVQQLMQVDIHVSSVSKRPQKLHQAASAIYVVTQEDIRRSGAVSIPEALRLVPGVLVSRVDQNQYAISIRGFNTEFTSQKLLVLIDGRSVYNPLFSGVFWTIQDTMLEDIDRIEVIRGPGAALWGSNAVAGVINIITKSSAETRGLLVSGGLGTEERGFGALRYGGRIGQNLNYRIYGKYRDRDDGKSSDGTDTFDDKQIHQAGFRSDWQATPDDIFTLQGDFYKNDTEVDVINHFVSFVPPHNQRVQGTTEGRGRNVIGRWNRQLGNGSGFKLQAYYDNVHLENKEEPNDFDFDIADVEFQYDFLWGKGQKAAWGLNYRYVNFDILKTTAVDLPSKDTSQFGFFFHDEITIVPETWNLILGARLEHNEFSGFEIQPNLRTVWTPSLRHTLWASVSRAVRIPSLVEDELVMNSSPAPNLITRVINDGRTEAEELIALEVGYRVKPSETFSVDLTGYVHFYDDLIDNAVGTPGFEPPNVIVPINLQNGMEGEVFGTEISVEWKPIEPWTLSGSYTYYTVDLRRSTDAVIGRLIGVEEEPNHLFNVRSYLELPHNLEFDTLVYYQSDYPGRNIDAYTRLDLRLGWRPDPKVELSLVGQNILDPQHPEFNNERIFRTETQRSFYFKGTINF
jgi:iron complex outermembrane receptor protein